MLYILLVILTNFNGIALQFYRIAVELHRSAKEQRFTLISSRGCFKHKCYCRRQTAEEREQERQAATKYFLSMQMNGLQAADDEDEDVSPGASPPPSTSLHVPQPQPPSLVVPTAAGPPPPTLAASTLPQSAVLGGSAVVSAKPNTISSLESLTPWTEN